MSEILDRLRGKYPEYDDIPDDELAFRVTEKYPEYKDTELLTDAMPARSREFGEIRATDITKDFAGNVLGGVKRAITGPGRLAGLGGAIQGVFEPIAELGRRAYIAHPEVGKAVLGPQSDPEMAAGVAAAAPGFGPKSLKAVPELLGRGSARRLAQAEGVAKSVPEPTVAPTRPLAAAPKLPQKRPWTEEEFAPAQEEWVRDLPTPFDRPGEAGRVTAGHLVVGSRAVAGGLVGQEQGETVIDKIRYGAAGAAIAAAASPALLRRGMQMAQRPRLGAGPSEMAKASAKWKAKTNVFTPLDTARGLPQATNLVEDAFASDDLTHLIRKTYTDQLDFAYKSVGYNAARISHIHQAIDNGAVATLSAADQGVAGEVLDVISQLAQRSGTPLGARPLADTFRQLRKGQPYRYGMYDVLGDLRAAAKKITVDGGMLPDGTPVPSFLARSRQLLKSMKAEGYPTEVIQYYQQYVSDFTKGPKIGRSLISPQTAERIKSVEFMRTIGLNVGSAITNMLQQANTFSQVSPGSFIHAYYDLFKNPQVVDLARRLGVTSEVLAKADIEAFGSATKFDAMLKGGAKKTGFLFGKVEELNRLHAFAAGLRDASKQGLSWPDAIQYAQRVVNKTQFRFGLENAPGPLRGGSPVLSVLGQYKSYQIQQTLFLKNLILHDPKGLAKYLGAIVGLAGPDAVTGHHVGDYIRKRLSDAFGGDPANYKFRGALGEIGISLAQQIGIGALPIENLQSLVFLLPGPALSHVVDTMSLVSNKDWSPSAATRGKFGTELSPDQWAALATRFFSVELDRVRQAMKALRSPDNMLREAQDLPEALGLRPAQGGAIRRLTPLEPVKNVLGSKITDVEEYGQARQEIGERTARWQELVRRKSEAIAAGNTAEVTRLNRLGVKEFGQLPRVGKQGGKAARQRQQTPALERQLKNVPKSVRRQLRKEAED